MTVSTALMRIAAAAIFALLAACAQTTPPPAAPGSDAATPAVASDGGNGNPHGAPREPARAQNLPRLEMEPDVLYKLLLAEIAQQRDQADIAVQAYLQLARETHDPRIAQRATEIAWSARAGGPALEAAQIWLAADPDSMQAQQVLVTMLIGQARLTEAKPILEKLLASDRDSAGGLFLHLGMMLVRHPDKPGVLMFLQDLAKPYPDVPEAHYVVARAAAEAGQGALALSETRATLKLRPEWEEAAIFQAQLLQQSSPDDATAYLKDYLAGHPRAMDVRLAYAKLLVGAQRYEDARGEFQQLMREFPDSPDVAMAVGMLSLQLKDYDVAQAQFRHAIDANYKDPNIPRYYIGQIAEERKDYPGALAAYAAITEGEQYIPARARYAGVLIKQGKVAEARKYLEDLQAKAKDAHQRTQFIQLEAQVLRDASRYEDAYNVLARALKKKPESPDLLYDQAMVAEKLGHIDVLETNLRKVIQIKPDYAHAYNALGYTLADRNTRLPEAYSLIDKALKLAPDDPFIIDSMGWVLYRMGRNDDSLDYLQRAFGMRQDAEIAAHLGEVLWSSGRRDEARKVWNDALKDNPGNDTLSATVKKFTP